MSQAAADSAQQTADGEAQAPVSESIQETTNTPEAGNEGQGGSGEVETTAAAEEQGQATPAVEERIAGVQSVDEYEAMMADVASNPESYANPAEDAHPDDQNQQPAPVTEGEETLPPEGEEGEQQAEAAGEPEDAESEGVGKGDEGEPATEEEGEQGQKPPQFRLRPTEKVDAEALRIMKAAEAAQSPVSLTDALTIAKRNLGIEDKPTVNPDQAQGAEGQGDGEADGDDPTQGVTLVEAKAELRDLRKKHSQALRDGDLDEAADVMDQIGEAEDLIDVVGERERAEATQTRQKHDSDFEASVATATDLYPDFGEQKSEFYERCTEIDEVLRDTNDPRYFESEKPLMIAQMAARELNIAPKAKGRTTKKPVAKPATEQAAAPATAQKPQQASTSPQPPRTEKPGQLPAASGASRTSGAPTGAAASLAEQVEAISGTEDFERLAQQVHEQSR